MSATPMNARLATFRPRRPRANWQHAGPAYLMIAGVVLIVGVFTVYPYAYALWASLQNLSPIMPPSFAGLENYRSVLTSTYFGGAVRTTLAFTFAAVPLIVGLGVAVATLLNQRFFGHVFLKAFILLPWAIPATITGIIWKGMFDGSWGAVNAVLYKFGLIGDYVPWLTTPVSAMLIAIIAHTWTQFPLAAVLILASMQSISQELYESAAIDGAGTWQRFRFITLPGIRGMMIIVALYEVLVGLTAFDLIYSMTGGGPGTATTVIGYFIWSETFKMLSFGRGAALAIILAMAALLIIFAMMRFLPRDAFMERQA
jgi:multiple sugar transport system permease protein